MPWRWWPRNIQGRSVACVGHGYRWKSISRRIYLRCVPLFQMYLPSRERGNISHQSSTQKCRLVRDMLVLGRECIVLSRMYIYMILYFRWWYVIFQCIINAARYVIYFGYSPLDMFWVIRLSGQWSIVWTIHIYCTLLYVMFDWVFKIITTYVYCNYCTYHFVLVVISTFTSYLCSWFFFRICFWQ